MQTTSTEREQLKLFWNVFFYCFCILDLALIIELYTSMLNPACCGDQSKGTSQVFLLEKQIDQIGVKHLGELEDIRAQLEVIDEETSGFEVRKMVVDQLTAAALQLENDILDYSQEFENNRLKKILSLLKVFRVNIEKLANFDLYKYGGKNFIKYALKNVDQIIEILDDENGFELTGLI